MHSRNFVDTVERCVCVLRGDNYLFTEKDISNLGSLFLVSISINKISLPHFPTSSHSPPQKDKIKKTA